MTWWRRLLRMTEKEEQLDKELRFHLDSQVADLIAQGHDPQAARREARLAFGGPEQIKEQCRDVRPMHWLEDLWQDLRYAMRVLRQKPGFTAIALSTLALGIGGATVMFTVVRSVLLAPLDYPDAGRLIAVNISTQRSGDTWGFSYADFQDLKSGAQSFSWVGAWAYSSFTLTQPGNADHVDGRVISADLVPALGVRLEAGRPFLPEEDRPGAPPVVIISDELWQQRFGRKPEAIGAQVVMDGTAYTIVGVAPPSLRLDGIASVFTPLGQNTLPRMFNRNARFMHVAGRLRAGVSLAQSRAELELIGRRLAEKFPRSNSGVGFAPHPLLQDIVANVGPTLWLLFGAVAAVLLIACVNIASLLLARAISRQRELAMRAALGARRGRLVRQCLTESALLGIVGGALGFAIAMAGTPAFLALWPDAIPRAEEVRMDWLVALFVLAVSLLCGLLFGLAPAWRASTGEALHSGSRIVHGSSRRLHGSLVSAEIALTLVLLVCAGILGRTMLQLSSLGPGFRMQNAIEARVALGPGAIDSPARARASWQELLEQMRRIPGVQSAALVDIIPMRGGLNVLPYWATANPPPPDQTPQALATTATPDYLKTMGVPLLRGRFLNDEDRLGGETVVVIDDVLAQHAFGNRDPVGQRLWCPALDRAAVKVVGVVGHVRYWGLAGDDASSLRDQMYYPFAQVPDNLMAFFSTIMSIAVRTSVPPASMVQPLRRTIGGSGHVLYEVHTMEELARASLGRQRFLLVLFGIFAGLALLLASIGIYGVLAYLTRQRIPEIGVRIAMGASRLQVMTMVLRESIGMLAAGILIGAGGAIGAARVLNRLVQGVNFTSPWTFVVMISVLVAAGLFASFWPARQASRVDPLQALRQE